MKKTILFASLLIFFLLSHASLGTEMRIIILPFDSISREDITFIQEVVPKLLTSRLALKTGLETEISELPTPNEALAKYGPAYLISGTITKLGTTYSLDIGVSGPIGEKIGEFFSSAEDENGILASLEDLAKDVAGVIPMSETGSNDVADAQVAAGVSPPEAADLKQAGEIPQKRVAEEEKVDQQTSEPEAAGGYEELAAVKMVEKGSEEASEGEKGFSEINKSQEPIPIADEPEKTPLLEKFKTRHEEIQKASGEGKLPGNAAEEADALWISLQKYLIDNSTRIEKYKLEAKEYSGLRQEDALDNIVKATAEREQTLMDYIIKLDELAKKGQKPLTTKQEDSDTTKDSPDPEKDALDSTKDEKKSWWDKIEIEIKAEDIITEDQPAE